ncbi:MAG: tRNA (adenosine(37)-N6)-threonylcarbamoyltransferase complex ATPase subunit type 1 TsaE [Patescibacteria group bacterium]|nr:tRNA (adenosine(37)-N6)-threonylcarbamoyltransferase complex ATPase subunit type 1 TsaE [Patescibacteria group bacterium]
MFKKLRTTSFQKTQKLGEKLAQDFLISKKIEKKALVIGLEGDLGGGKTTFVQGFAKGLGIKEKILSPTFVILKKFKILNGRFETFYHIDCYRIGGPKDILDLGFNEIISNSKNIVLIEWANKIKKILPKQVIVLTFEFIDEKVRKIMLK